MKSFALNLAFVMRLKATQKWPIDKQCSSSVHFVSVDRQVRYRLIEVVCSVHHLCLTLINAWCRLPADQRISWGLIKILNR